MKIHNVYLSQQIGDKKPESVHINMDNLFPSFEDIKDSNQCLQYQGEKLEQILHDSLPGGTYDSLLYSMMKRSISSLVVSHKDKIK